MIKFYNQGMDKPNFLYTPKQHKIFSLVARTAALTISMCWTERSL